MGEVVRCMCVFVFMRVTPHFSHRFLSADAGAGMLENQQHQRALNYEMQMSLMYYHALAISEGVPTVLK